MSDNKTIPDSELDDLSGGRGVEEAGHARGAEPERMHGAEPERMHGVEPERMRGIEEDLRR
jgi:hypothetical protein